MKVKLEFFKCMGIMLANLCHPYIVRTTVLTDYYAQRQTCAYSGIKGGVAVQAKLKILCLPDNEKDGRFVERLCRFTGQLNASSFPYKLANMSRFMTIHLQANKKAGSLGWRASPRPSGSV